MLKLKSFIIKKINRDLLDVYKYLDPTVEDFSVVIHLCESLSPQKKLKFSQNLAKKLQKEHNNKQTLNLLILCDFLSATKPQIFQNYPDNMKLYLQKRKKIKGNSKQQKINLAQSNYIYFYLQYLKQKIWHVNLTDNLNINNLQQSLTYCESAINGLKLVIRHDFIIQYVLNFSEYKSQIKISLQNVLRRISEDLTILIRFMDKWNYVIVQDNVYSVMVNDIYQQLIYVSKNVKKLQYMNNKIGGNIKFAKYEINKNLNTVIEKSMVGRQQQRKSFYMQKRLKTDGDIFNQDQLEAQITQSQIYMKFKL